MQKIPADNTLRNMKLQPKLLNKKQTGKKYDRHF